MLAISLWGTVGLQFDPNNRVFFGSGHERFSELLDFEERFGSSANLLYAISSEASIWRTRRLDSAIRWLTQRVWQHQSVGAVESVANYPHATSDGDDSLVVTNVLDYVCPEGARECREARSSALLKPHLINRVVDRDGTTFAVVGDVNLDSSSPELIASISEESAAIKAEFSERYPEFSLYLTGSVPMMHAFYEAARSDSGSLLIIAFLVIAAILLVFLRDVVVVLLLLGLGGSSVLVTLGVAGWAGFVINTATATVPLIVFTLVTAAAMHVFLSVLQHGGCNTRRDVKEAVRSGVAATWRPVVLTAITTVLGLLSMLWVSAPPLRELGILTSVGVAVGALLTLTVVPIALCQLSRLRSSRALSLLQKWMCEVGTRTKLQLPPIAPITALVLVALLGLRDLTFDEDFVRYFGGGIPFRADTEAISRTMAGPYHIDVLYDSREMSGVFASRTITDVDYLAEQLKSDPRVVNVTSPVDVLREVSDVVTGTTRLSGLSKEQLAQLFLSYELSLGKGQSTRDLVDTEQRRARISVLLSDVSMREIRNLVERARAWAQKKGIEDRVTITGEGVPTAYLSGDSVREMSLGIAVTILLSVALVALYIRDAVVSFAVLAATAIPLLAGFGIWGWIQAEIGMAACLVIATTIGVVLDDTIHFTHGFLDGLRNQRLDSADALAYSIYRTGTAILVTTVTLVAGLLVLTTSEFRMNSTFGVCASLVLVLALLYNLLVAPRILGRAQGGRIERRLESESSAF